jgi:hypothetical protein
VVVSAPVEKAAKAPAKPRAKAVKAPKPTAALESNPEMSGGLNATEELTYNLIEIDPDETLTDVDTGDMLKIPESGELELKINVVDGKVVGYTNIDTGNTYAVK